jgi:hypothetical protein
MMNGRGALSGAPLELDSVRPDATAVFRWSLHELCERRCVRIQIVREEREVREPATVRRDLPPAMGQGAPEIAERDELEIGSVHESDQRVMRDAVGVLAARRHCETAPAMVGHRGREITDDEDDVVELAEHRRIDNTRERWLRAVRGSNSRAPT